MMAAEWSKKQRRELTNLQGIAWERELAAALQVLRGDFDAWERSEISAFDLSDRIHEYHNGKSRELFNRYSGSSNHFVILRAIASGVIAESELSNELHEYLSDDIVEVRKRWNSSSEDEVSGT